MLLAALLTALAAPLAQAQGRPVPAAQPQGERLGAIAVTPPQMADPTRYWEVYEEAYDLAASTGIDLPGEVAFTWSTMEQHGWFGGIRYLDEGAVKVIGYARKHNWPLVITLQPFETLQSRIPDDLTDHRLDTPELLARWRAFIDAVYELTKDVPAAAVVLGNEFDVRFAVEQVQGRDRWEELDRLIQATRTHVRSKPGWAQVPFSIEATFDGLTNPATRKQLLRLNRHADLIGVSYYPLKDDRVLEPEIFESHLEQLFALYPQRRFDFYQFGYPSSERIGGSLEKQRQFVEQAFAEWDAHSDRIRLLTFTWLYDIDSGLADQLRKNVLGELNPTLAFQAFVGSLGLHGRNVGEPKPAFVELQQQLTTRGWGRKPAAGEQ